MRNFKRLAYALLALSYFLAVLTLIYANSEYVQYKQRQLVAGISVIVLVLMWLFSAFVLSKQTVEGKEDRLTAILKFIAHIPIYIILFPILIIPAIIQLILDSFRNKVKPLLKNGFNLKSEKVENKKIYYLSKGNITLKIREFDLYEISEDSGATFALIEESKLFSSEERGAFRENLFQYYGSDYRDKDYYDPTRKLISLLMQSKIVGVECEKTAKKP